MDKNFDSLRIPKNFRAELSIVARKVADMERRQGKPVTQADAVRDLLRRTLGKGKSYLTREEKVDHTG